MGVVFARLRHASPGALAFSAGMALVAAVGLDRADPRASFLVGVLFGLGIGLGATALAVWQQRARA